MNRQSFGSPEDESLDPRIQVELEKLNKASDDINSLELDLDAQAETQRVALKFERACSMHEAAKEMVQLAELGHMKKGEEFDPAWQEMLNHATMKVNEAEKERNESDAEHMRSAQAYNDIDQQVQRLQKDLKRSISRSSSRIRWSFLQLNNIISLHNTTLIPYFEMKARFNQILEEKKRVVSALEEQVVVTKSIYAAALRDLEQISDEIHRNRIERRKWKELGKRGAGVGAESPLPPPSRNKSIMETSLQSRACRSESDVSLAINPDTVNKSPEKTRRRSYRIAIEKSSMASPNLLDPSYTSSHSELEKSVKFSKQDTLPKYFPEAPSVDETYKSLHSRDASKSLPGDTHTVSTEQATILEETIYNPHGLSIDEYFHHRRHKSVATTGSEQKNAANERANCRTSCPLTDLTPISVRTNRPISNGTLSEGNTKSINIPQRDHSQLDHCPSSSSAGSKSPTERHSFQCEFQECTSIDKEAKIVYPSRHRQISPGASRPLTQHSETNVKDKDTYIYKSENIPSPLETRKLYQKVQTSNTISPSTERRGKLQGIIIKIDPDSEEVGSYNKSQPIGIPAYYSRPIAKERKQTTDRVRSEPLQLTELMSSRSVEETGVDSSLHKRSVNHEQHRRPIHNESGRWNRFLQETYACKGSQEVARDSVIDDVQEQDKGNMKDNNTRPDVMSVVTLAANGLDDVTSHRSVVRKKSQDFLRSVDADEEVSDSESVTSVGPMMDDDTLEMLTLTFDDSLTVSDKGCWKHQSLPVNLQYLQPYMSEKS